MFQVPYKLGLHFFLFFFFGGGGGIYSHLIHLILASRPHDPVI